MVNESAQQQRRIGIVVVHGVRRQRRYAMQDSVTEALVNELNRCDKIDTWKSALEYPRVAPNEPALPTISVVSSSGSNVTFDVVEAFWSPLTKGRVNPFRLLLWLFRNIFTPANTDAAIVARREKTLFDFFYVTASGAGAVVLILLAMLISAFAISRLWSISGHDQADLSFILTTAALDVLGSIFAIQSSLSTFKVLASRKRLPWARGWAIAVSWVVAIGCVVAAYFSRAQSGLSLGSTALLMVVAIGFIKLATALLAFLSDFLGDIMVYTTRDENNAHFAIRTSVIASVRGVLIRALGDKPFGRAAPYDRVIVMAHSLGATIALDAIMSVFEHAEEQSIEQHCWKRLRAFVTFGAAIEKARYFSEAPEISNEVASYRQLREEVYGQIFTSDLESLQSATSPIMWCNYWYLQDPVSNEMNFRSFLPPGQSIGMLGDAEMSARSALAGKTVSNEPIIAAGRSLCENVEGMQKVRFMPLRLNIHGDYIKDSWFWCGDSQESRVAVLNVLDPDRLPPPIVLSTSRPTAPNFEIVPRKEAARYRRYLTLDR